MSSERAADALHVGLLRSIDLVQKQRRGLKRYALFFDQLMVRDCDALIETMRNEGRHHDVADFEFLRDRRFLADYAPIEHTLFPHPELIDRKLRGEGPGENLLSRATGSFGPELWGLATYASIRGLVPTEPAFDPSDLSSEELDMYRHSYGEFEQAINAMGAMMFEQAAKKFDETRTQLVKLSKLPADEQAQYREKHPEFAAFEKRIRETEQAQAQLEESHAKLRESLRQLAKLRGEEPAEGNVQPPMLPAKPQDFFDSDAIREAQAVWQKRWGKKQFTPEMLAETIASTEVRRAAVGLRLFWGRDAICIGKGVFGERGPRNIDRVVNRQDLFEIIVGGLPIAEETVPWADLLEFRSEPDSRRQLRALRRWVNKMTKGELTYAEAVDEIEHLKDEFRAHMKAAGLKMGSGVLRTLVVGAAELVENAFKLKLKDLAEAPFKLREARADLVEAERRATGHELAYVVRASAKFAGG